MTNCDDLSDAREVDALLEEWLATPVPAMAAIDVAAIVAAARERAEPQLVRRAAGWRPALMAASFVMMLGAAGWLAVQGGLPGAPAVQMVSTQTPSAGDGAGEADLAFDLVFTPTAAEEEVI